MAMQAVPTCIFLLLASSRRTSSSSSSWKGHRGKRGQALLTSLPLFIPFGFLCPRTSSEQVVHFSIWFSSIPCWAGQQKSVSPSQE